MNKLSNQTWKTIISLCSLPVVQVTTSLLVLRFNGHGHGHVTEWLGYTEIADGSPMDLDLRLSQWWYEEL
jgi:hypothetical protein